MLTQEFINTNFVFWFVYSELNMNPFYKAFIALFQINWFRRRIYFCVDRYIHIYVDIMYLICFYIFFIRENVVKDFLFWKYISEIFFCKNNCLLSVKIPRYSLNCVPLCQVIRGGILMKISRVCSQYRTSQWSNLLSFITCFNNNWYLAGQRNHNRSSSFSSRVTYHLPLDSRWDLFSWSSESLV